MPAVAMLLLRMSRVVGLFFSFCVEGLNLQSTVTTRVLLVNRSVFLLFSVMQSKKKRKNKALELDTD